LDADNSIRRSSRRGRREKGGRDKTPIRDPYLPPHNSPAGLDIYLGRILPAFSSATRFRKQGAAWCLARIIHVSQATPILVTSVFDRIYTTLLKHIRNMGSSKHAHPNAHYLSCLSNLMLLARQLMGSHITECIEAIVDLLASREWTVVKAAAEALYATALCIVGGGHIVPCSYRNAVTDKLQKVKHHKVLQVRQSIKGALCAWKSLREVDGDRIRNHGEAVNHESFDFSEITGAKGAVLGLEFNAWATEILQRGEGGVVPDHELIKKAQRRDGDGDDDDAHDQSLFDISIGKHVNPLMTPQQTLRNSMANAAAAFRGGGGKDRYAPLREHRDERGDEDNQQQFSDTKKSSLHIPSTDLHTLQKDLKRITTLVRKMNNCHKVILTRMDDLQTACESGFKALSHRLIDVERRVSLVQKSVEGTLPAEQAVAQGGGRGRGNNMDKNNANGRDSKNNYMRSRDLISSPALHSSSSHNHPLHGGNNPNPFNSGRGAAGGGIWNSAVFHLRVREYDNAFRRVLDARDELLLVRLLGRTQAFPEQVLSGLHPNTAESLFKALSDMIGGRTFVRNTLPWICAAVKMSPVLPANIETVKAISNGLAVLCKDSTTNIGHQIAGIAAMFSKAHVHNATMEQQPQLVQNNPPAISSNTRY